MRTENPKTPDTIQESIAAAGFTVESDGGDRYTVTRGDESHVIMPSAGDGQVWAIVPSTLTTKRACEFEAAVKVAEITTAGVAFLLEYGFDQKLGDTVNSAFARDKDKAKARLAGTKMLADIVAGTMRSGGGGGSPMTPELKARRLALDVHLAAVTLPEGVTVAKLARDMDKAVALIGGDPVETLAAIESDTAIFLAAAESVAKAAAARRVAQHPETVAAIES